MTLPASGPIAFSDIAAELGRPGTALSFSDTDVRDLAGKAPGVPIALSDFYGKSSVQPLTLSQMFPVSGGTLGSENVYRLGPVPSTGWRSASQPQLQALLNYINVANQSSQPVVQDGIALESPVVVSGVHNTRIRFTATPNSVFVPDPAGAAHFEYDRTNLGDIRNDDLAFASLNDAQAWQKLMEDYGIPYDAVYDYSVSLIEEDTRRSIVITVPTTSLIFIGDITFNVMAQGEILD